MERGELVPAEIGNRMLRDRLLEADCRVRVVVCLSVSARVMYAGNEGRTQAGLSAIACPDFEWCF